MYTIALIHKTGVQYGEGISKWNAWNKNKLV